MAAVTPDEFRRKFPAFGDPALFPDEIVKEWLDLAYSMLPSTRWAELFPLGQQLFTAHFLSVETAEERAAAKGSIPGATPGLIASKSVGSVSVSYDTSGAIEPGGGHWNSSSYGRRYLRFARMVGTGGIQI